MTWKKHHLTQTFILIRYDNSIARRVENFLTTTFSNHVVNDFASSIYFQKQVIITIILNLKCVEFLRTKTIFVEKNLKTFKASSFSLSVDSYDIFATKALYFNPNLSTFAFESCIFQVVGLVTFLSWETWEEKTKPLFNVQSKSWTEKAQKSSQN